MNLKRQLANGILKNQRKYLLLFLLLHTVASFYYISQHNITFDEPQYFEYAKRWLHGKPERIVPLDDSKSPVVAICWLPRMVRQVINPAYQLNDYGRKDQQEGRYMMIVFSFLAALYVYRWCKDLYGTNDWMLPLLLLLFDPLYLAYSTLIITDLACGAMLVTILYHFSAFLRTGKKRQLIFAATYTGLGIVTKQTLLFVVLLLPLLTVIHLANARKLKSLLHLRTLSLGGLFALMVLLVINTAYYFYHSFVPLGQYHFQSESFRHLQASLVALNNLPVPVPEPFVQSLDMLQANAAYGPGKPGSTYNGVYLLGTTNMKSGYWYYYLVVSAFKMPLGTLMLLLSGIVVFIKKFNRTTFFRHYVFLVGGIVFYGILLSCFNRFQSGIRHLLVIYPLLFICLGKVLFEARRATRFYKTAAYTMAAFSIISMLTFFPYIIPYTNELITDKKMVYRKIMDSSIDYGQSDSSVNNFIAAHPGFKRPTGTPMPGQYAVPMGQVLSLTRGRNNPYNWYQQLAPVGLYRNVILLYNVSDKDAQNIR